MPSDREQEFADRAENQFTSPRRPLEVDEELILVEQQRYFLCFGWRRPLVYPEWQDGHGENAVGRHPGLALYLEAMAGDPEAIQECSEWKVLKSYATDDNGWQYTCCCWLKSGTPRSVGTKKERWRDFVKRRQWVHVSNQDKLLKDAKPAGRIVLLGMDELAEHLRVKMERKKRVWRKIHALAGRLGIDRIPALICFMGSILPSRQDRKSMKELKARAFMELRVEPITLAEVWRDPPPKAAKFANDAAADILNLTDGIRSRIWKTLSCIPCPCMGRRDREQPTQPQPDPAVGPNQVQQPNTQRPPPSPSSITSLPAHHPSNANASLADVSQHGSLPGTEGGSLSATSAASDIGMPLPSFALRAPTAPPHLSSNSAANQLRRKQLLAGQGPPGPALPGINQSQTSIGPSQSHTSQASLPVGISQSQISAGVSQSQASLGIGPSQARVGISQSQTIASVRPSQASIGAAPAASQSLCGPGMEGAQPRTGLLRTTVPIAGFTHPALLPSPRKRSMPLSINELECASSHGLYVYGNIDHWVSYMDDDDYLALIEQKTGIRREDVSYWARRSDVLLPAHYLAVDHNRRKIVLAIRGTTGVKDIYTDLLGEPMRASFGPGLKGIVHEGMYNAAKAIIEEVRDKLLDLARTHDKYDVLITGHSMGGGVSALLALMLRMEGCISLQQRARLRAICLAPAAVMDFKLAECCQSFVTSIIYRNDITPRIGLASLRKLLKIEDNPEDTEAGAIASANADSDIAIVPMHNADAAAVVPVPVAAGAPGQPPADTASVPGQHGPATAASPKKPEPDNADIELAVVGLAPQSRRPTDAQQHGSNKEAPVESEAGRKRGLHRLLAHLKKDKGITNEIEAVEAFCAAHDEEQQKQRAAAEANGNLQHPAAKPTALNHQAQPPATTDDAPPATTDDAYQPPTPTDDAYQPPTPTDDAYQPPATTDDAYQPPVTTDDAQQLPATTDDAHQPPATTDGPRQQPPAETNAYQPPATSSKYAPRKPIKQSRSRWCFGASKDALPKAEARDPEKHPHDLLLPPGTILWLLPRPEKSKAKRKAAKRVAREGRLPTRTNEEAQAAADARDAPSSDSEQDEAVGDLVLLHASPGWFADLLIPSTSAYSDHKPVAYHTALQSLIQQAKATLCNKPTAKA